MKRILFAGLLCLGCGGPAPLTVDMPLHLEDHLDAATVSGSELPVDIPDPIQWRFDEPQPDWASFAGDEAHSPVRVTRAADALRLTLTDAQRVADDDSPFFGAGIYAKFPDLGRQELAYLMIRARTEHAGELWVALGEVDDPGLRTLFSLFSWGSEAVPMIADGSVQSYLIPIFYAQVPEGTSWQRVGIGVNTREPGDVDILSVSFVSHDVAFAADPLGVKTVARSKENRRTLFTHTPGAVSYTVRVPTAGRLDLGLGVAREDAPVTFRITAASAGGELETLLEETYADRERWAQHSIDLSALQGQTVTLTLEAEAEQPGTVDLNRGPQPGGNGSGRWAAALP